MGDVEEVPRKGIRQAVELPHCVDPSGNLDPGSSCGGAHKREVGNAAGSKGERTQHNAGGVKPAPDP